MRHLALALSFSVGFLSLSQEIIWVRLVSFGQQGRPHAFSIVLAAFLVGIALGAIAGRRICVRSPNVLRAGGWVLLLAATVDLLALQAAPLLMAGPARFPGRGLVLVGLIALTAGLKGVLFPIVHHLGSDGTEGKVGRSVSRVYLGNVLGSTFGPIVTGFFVLDHVGVETAFAAVGAATAGLGTLALAHAGVGHRLAWGVPALLLAAAAFWLARPPEIIAAVARGTWPGAKLERLVQNKHGVVHVLSEDGFRGGPQGGGPVTYGGNTYDGRINVDMAVNSNFLDRAYLMAAIHPAPKRALVVGLSTGAWTRAILGMPGIEHVDVVEINPGYVELIRGYPQVAPLLADPRVHLHVDDGRRWLRAHPQERYDLIFQNTTFHWRAYSTMLLSREFFAELRSHLGPQGILAVNTTGSIDVFKTAVTVFPEVVRYRSFAYMSERPLVRRADARQVLQQCRVDGHPVFADPLFDEGGIGQHLLTQSLEPAAKVIETARLAEPAAVISDLNLLPEFRHGDSSPLPFLRRWLPPTPNAE